MAQFGTKLLALGNALVSKESRPKKGRPVKFCDCEVYRCRTQPPPPEFFHCSWIIQPLLPKLTSHFACAAMPAGVHRLPATHVLVVTPKLKLHLSESSFPAESNQAFRSGSVMASNCSCAKTLIIPSAPPTPAAGLLGPVAWISQALWQRSGLPTNAYLISTPLSVA